MMSAMSSGAGGQLSPQPLPSYAGIGMWRRISGRPAWCGSTGATGEASWGAGWRWSVVGGEGQRPSPSSSFLSFSSPFSVARTTGLPGLEEDRAGVTRTQAGSAPGPMGTNAVSRRRPRLPDGPLSDDGGAPHGKTSSGTGGLGRRCASSSSCCCSCGRCRRSSGSTAECGDRLGRSLEPAVAQL
jgi:hypothetical protein